MDDDRVALWYWLRGSSLSCVYELMIRPTESVASLREAIYNRYASRLGNVNEGYVDLYAIPFPNRESFYEELTQWDPSHHTALYPESTVSSVFANVHEDRRVLIIAEVTVPAFTCWICGDEAESRFPLEIMSGTVGGLKTAIKNMSLIRLNNVNSDEMEVFGVSIPLDGDIQQRLGCLTYDQPLPVWYNLFDVFPTGPRPGHLDIVIRVSPKRLSQQTIAVEEGGDLLAKLFKNTIEPKPTLVPSRAARSKDYFAIQKSRDAILDCRRPLEGPIGTVAPPIQLFHPAFASFSSEAFDPEYKVPDDLVRIIRELVEVFAYIHGNKSVRQSHLREPLERAIGRPLNTLPNDDGTTPDFAGRGSSGAYLIVGEEINELGTGGSDPSTQATFSSLRAYSQAKINELTRKCCCPSFIIASGGPWLTIMGGIITGKCVVQRLTDYLWMPIHSTHDDGQCLRIARIFNALRDSLDQLDQWYGTLGDVTPFYLTSTTSNHPRFFPSPDRFLYDGTLVKFAYEKPLSNLSSCVTFRAKTITDNPRDIVVKFVTSYGTEAHRKMASLSFAPELFYHGEINVTDDMPSYGDLRMVVMEYVEGRPLVGMEDGVPPAFKSDLYEAVTQLHANGYVFGDLREPNVFVTPARKFTAQLIDFDWAGEEGEVRYPLWLSRSIAWPEGVRELEPIRKEHDIHMLQRLLLMFS